MPGKSGNRYHVPVLSLVSLVSLVLSLVSLVSLVLSLCHLVLSLRGLEAIHTRCACIGPRIDFGMELALLSNESQPFIGVCVSQQSSIRPKISHSIIALPDDV